MRKDFFEVLYREMLKNDKIICLSGDLGYGYFENIKNMFPERYINVGASEQSMIGIAVGLALSGYTPVCYSITPFLIYRPFETIKLYLNDEKIPVKLVGSGRDKDYEVDGPSHDATGVEKYLDLLPNIKQYWPEYNPPLDYPDVADMAIDMLNNGKPSFISLRR